MAKLANYHLESEEVRERILSFYELFNKKDWRHCFEIIDPVLRDGNRVDFEGYSEMMLAFFLAYGPISDCTVDEVKLVKHVKNHDGRDFAYSNVRWLDRQKIPHQIRERWVRDSGGSWYSLLVGLVG